MRAMLVASLVLSAGLVGCIGTDDPGSIETAATNTTDTAEALAIPETLSFDGCTEQLGVFPFPAEEVEGDVPEGFTIVPMDPAGQTATLVAISYACDLELTAGPEPAAELWGIIQVEPPERYEDSAEDSFHGIVLGGFSTSPVALDAYHAWGLSSLEEGEVTLDLVADSPAARTGQVVAEGTSFSIRMATSVQGPVETQDAGQGRLFGVQGGEVTGIVDLSWTESDRIGQGEATISGSSPLMLVPETSGLAVHNWADGYGITFEPGPPVQPD